MKICCSDMMFNHSNFKLTILNFCPYCGEKIEKPESKETEGVDDFVGEQGG